MLNNEKMKNLSLIYDESFYEHQVDSSYISAQKYIEILFKFYRPKSVVDLGCGRGAWLKAFHESGSSEVVGFDGDLNSQSNMIDKDISFYPVDLNSKIEFDRKFDLAISLEVAEHLLPACAKTLLSQ
ncbi:class I SAM-dependent methyltransferase [Polynucleobacter paneuropaeus]|nr:class I SAM-dependent methyltransferase [Polynucleobacter paneuropaeus]